MSLAIKFAVQSDIRNDALAQMWRALESRSDAPFFLTWDWIGTWIEAFLLAPQVLTGTAGGQLVLLGLLVPGIRRELPLLRTSNLHLHETGSFENDIITIEYNDFLMDRDWAGRAENSAIRFVLSGMEIGGKRRDELHLRSVLTKYEDMLTGEDLFSTVTMRKDSWRVDLCSIRASGRPHLEHLSANTRYQIRRSIRQYEEAGPLTATWAKSVPEALQYFDALKSFHVAQWSRRGHEGAFAWPRWERFHRLLIARAFSNGGIELVRVACGEKTIGYLYNFRRAGTVYAYASGFLFEADNRLKPGLVSHCLCIEHHLRNGAAVYDFMAGTYRYKSDLGRPGPEMIYLVVQRRTPALRLEHALRALRSSLQKLMGRRAEPYARG